MIMSILAVKLKILNKAERVNIFFLRNPTLLYSLVWGHCLLNYSAVKGIINKMFWNTYL